MSTSTASVFKTAPLPSQPPTATAPRVAGECGHSDAKTPEAYEALAREIPDLADRLTELEHVRPDLAAFVAKLEASEDWAGWAVAVRNAVATVDTARSERLCIDCGAEDVATVAPGLTGGRVCSRCLREASPSKNFAPDPVSAPSPALNHHRAGSEPITTGKQACAACGSTSWKEAIFRAGSLLCAPCVRRAKVPAKSQTPRHAQAAQRQAHLEGIR